jgi:SagB-type dehydrogenase family enzyme
MTEHEEISNRPYPGGGADYELEIYPTIQRVPGIDRGLWYYHPLEHALYLVAPWDPRVERLVRETASKAPPGDMPDVLFQITARFQRLTYKYQSIPYAVALKDLGVLYQTFYLVATAMGLAPCAVGGGDSDLFAGVSGVPYFVEPQIGEFLLSSRNPDESTGPALPEAPRKG